jgi:hypothetical protein
MTLFRPTAAVKYNASVSADQHAVVARLRAAKLAAPGYIGKSAHKTGATSVVRQESWDSKESYEAFKAANIADIEYLKTLKAAHNAATGIKVSKFQETI